MGRLLGGPVAGAADLMARLGGLGPLLGAETADLARELPEDAAWRLKLVHEIACRALRAPLQGGPLRPGSPGFCGYLRLRLGCAPREEFRVMFLDGGGRVLAEEVLGQGTVDHAPVYPREVVRRALELGADGLVLLHNHPSGDPTPSAADIDMTRQVAEAGRVFGIEVLDHFVAAREGVAGFRALGLL